MIHLGLHFEDGKRNTQSKKKMAALFFQRLITGLCNRRGSKTLEMAHPEKPTPSGFRAKNYKIRLGWNVLIPLNPKFQVD